MILKDFGSSQKTKEAFGKLFKFIKDYIEDSKRF